VIADERDLSKLERKKRRKGERRGRTEAKGKEEEQYNARE